MANGYDAIVIGGGHNGLCAGAYLAKSGANTIVLEKRYKTGGAADTSTPWPEHPDFKVTTYSYVSGLIPPSVVKELQLERHGYKIFPMGPVYQAYPDGRSLQFDSGDTAANVPRISKFSERDASRLGKYDEWLEGLADILGPLLMKVPPRLGSKKIGDLLDLGKLSWGLRKNISQRTVADFTRMMTMSLTDFLDDWFESEQLKGILTIDGVIGTWAGPDEPGTAYVLLHHAITDIGDGQLSNWGFPEGGMGAVSDAFRRSAESFGCKVRTEAPVEKILTSNGRVKGVVLEGGEELYAPVVITAIHPQITFLQHLDRGELPAQFVEDIENFKSRSGTVKVNLALDRLPNFTADPNPKDGSVPHHLTGSVELSFSPGYVEKAFQDAKAGRGAEGPFSDGVIPTVVDKTLAPEGVHIMSLFTQWCPQEWVDAPHEQELDAYANRIIKLYDQLAPGFESSIIAKQVLGPWHMEDDIGMIGGNIFHGELAANQLFHMRPAPGYADYRSPIKGLYQAHSGTHAGGGVNGIPGWHAV
ncbi:MAG: NAD(P)/FAD-dependent oxidoreductase, partial [Actinobacteria bacterium]|nr:NAD(P)/FAD-dependent oxidoreductase [Actinomycetota bacterium]